MLILFCSWSASAAAVTIYRSIGPGNILALASGAGNDLVIAGALATFSNPLPDRAGVGDVLQYDADGNGSVDHVAFITSRISAAQFVVQDASGSAPVPTVAADQDWSLFRAYTSLSEAEAGAENTGVDAALRNFDAWSGGRDLVAGDEIWNLACYADAADTTFCEFNGWTTDATHYLRVFTPRLPSEAGVSQRHDGKWSDSAYHLVLSHSTVLRNRLDFLRLEGLQIKIASVDNGMQICLEEMHPGEGDVRVSACIFVGDPTAAFDWHTGIKCYSAGSGALRVWNSLFYDFNGGNNQGGIIPEDAETTFYLYNNTWINCLRGIFSNGGEVVAKNNLAQGCTDGYWGSFSAASDYNLSDLAADAPGAHSRNSATVIFVNAGGQDYHLSLSDTSARGAGADLSLDPDLAFNDDIDSQPRLGSWDIGADEIFIPTPTPTATPAATPTRTPPALTNTIFNLDRTLLKTSRGEACRITFSLVTPGRVRIKVFDLTGRKIATLLDGEQSAGRHELVWNGAGASSGTYFIYFESGNHKARKKLVVVR